MLGTLGRVMLFLILIALLAALLLAIPLSGLVARAGTQVRISDLVGIVAILAATMVMLRAVDVRPWSEVGLGRMAARPLLLGWGAGFGGGAIALACVALLAVGWLHVVPAPDGSSLGAALRISAMLVPAALVEELLCRGYLFTAVRDSVGTRGAVILTSVGFGLMHLTNTGATVESVAIVMLAGVFLAAVRVVFDSLYAAWAAHVAWNWVMAVPLHAPVSGLAFEAPDYRTVSTGPAWITGGVWGPEGGLAAALGMMAGLAYLHARHRRAQARLGRGESEHDG